MKDVLKDLELLIRSRYGLLHLDTDEEERVGALLLHLADALGVPFFTWSRSQGLRRSGFEGAVYDTRDPLKALRHVAAAEHAGIYHFPGAALAPELRESDPMVALLRDAVTALEPVTGAVVLTGTGLALPPSLDRRTATVSLPGPGPGEYRDLLGRLLRDFHDRGRVDVSLSEDERDVLVRHLSGLTLMEAEKILTKAILEDRTLSVDDIRHVIDAKKEVVEREGLLEYYPVEDTLAEVADLHGLRGWLAKREAAVRSPERAEEYGLAFPRGMLLLGVPGCGKSLSAKAVARQWGMPLLKLDPSNLYNKYIGESERNFKRAMKAAERMSPVILWVDEIEKAFAAGGSEDGGVSQRILGSFLSWMQERRGDVFVVATANDVSRLPPELLRKGRFDEIFFVDLPDAETRREIFRIHLESRNQAAEAFDLDALAEATAGFSGSEVEGVVVSGLYTAFAARQPLASDALLEEAERTRPLSVTMSERVRALREWARGRTVPAN